MSIGDAIVLGLVQGLTEFLPVSSSGHLILARDVLNITTGGLAFDAVLQGATVLAVIIYFWRDIMALIVGSFRYLVTRSEGRDMFIMSLAIVVGTIPAAIAGIFLEEWMETTFRSATLVAVTLLIGSAIMYAAERMMRRAGERRADATIRDGLIAGLFQMLALVPGMSRSGMTISGGVFAGLAREAAARFAFLLSIPILLGSSLKKFLDLYQSGDVAHEGTVLIVGCTVAFLSGLAVIHWLMQYLRTRTLMPFVWYRIALAGIIVAVVFL